MKEQQEETEKKRFREKLRKGSEQLAEINLVETMKCTFRCSREDKRHVVRGREGFTERRLPPRVKEKVR